MRYLLSVAVLVVWVGVVGAATIHVPADQPTIQAGIDAAVDGDTVPHPKALRRVGYSAMKLKHYDNDGSVRFVTFRTH